MVVSLASSPKGLKMQRCYACDEVASTSEHVPPRCLFPKSKDLQSGRDLRKALIKVPSCVEHNSAKSKDDEYLLYALAMSIAVNKVATTQFETKIWRAINRNPSLALRMLKNVRPVVAVDTKDGTKSDTVTFKIDDARFYTALENLSRGLYYYHVGMRWLAPVVVYPEFLLSASSSQWVEANASRESIIKNAELAFASALRHGDNPEVFCYRVRADFRNSTVGMRLTFYGGNNVSVIFRMTRVMHAVF